MGILEDALSGAAYVLDTPGSLTRGVLAGRFGERLSGRDLLSSYGLADPEDDSLMAGVRDIGTSILTDPLTYFGGALASKAGRLLSPGMSRFSALRQARSAIPIAKGVEPGGVIPRIIGGAADAPATIVAEQQAADVLGAMEPVVQDYNFAHPPRATLPFGSSWMSNPNATSPERAHFGGAVIARDYPAQLVQEARQEGLPLFNVPPELTGSEGYKNLVENFIDQQIPADKLTRELAARGMLVRGTAGAPMQGLPLPLRAAAALQGEGRGPLSQGLGEILGEATVQGMVPRGAEAQAAAVKDFLFNPLNPARPNALFHLRETSPIASEIFQSLPQAKEGLQGLGQSLGQGLQNLKGQIGEAVSNPLESLGALFDQPEAPSAFGQLRRAREATRLKTLGSAVGRELEEGASLEEIAHLRETHRPRVIRRMVDNARANPQLAGDYPPLIRAAGVLQGMRKVPGVSAVPWGDASGAPNALGVLLEDLAANSMQQRGALNQLKSGADFLFNPNSANRGSHYMSYDNISPLVGSLYKNLPMLAQKAKQAALIGGGLSAGAAGLSQSQTVGELLRALQGYLPDGPGPDEQPYLTGL